jgi:hypothetical protein
MIKNSAVIVLVIMLASVSLSYGQCYIKSTDQTDGHITYYLDPELVSQTSDMGIALSVQRVGENYYLAITFQFAKQAVPLEEKVALDLENGYSLELEMYTMQVANASGVELTMAVYYLLPEQIEFFTKSKLSAIKFNSQSGQSYNFPITSSNEVLVRQLKCFGK